MHKARVKLAAATSAAQPKGTPGTTRSYNRMENGRPQRVSQYANHRPPSGQAPGQVQQASPLGGSGLGKLPRTKTSWGQVTVGAVLDFGGEPWKVLANSVQTAKGQPNSKGVTSGKSTGSKGKGVNTGKPRSTASKGGVQTGAGSKSNVTLTHVLENMWTGKRVQITLHAGFQVLVY